jgi:hypothetical protein
MAWQRVGGEFRGDWVVVRAVDYLRVVIAQEGEKKTCGHTTSVRNGLRRLHRLTLSFPRLFAPAVVLLHALFALLAQFSG